MSDPFRDKVALISGSSRGVGFALARHLADRGARIVLTARGRDRLEQSRSVLEESGAEVVAVAGDVGIWEDARRMVGAALDTFGQLDILVNNAGISMRGNFADLAPDVCSEVIATNLTGSILLTRAAIEPLQAARGHVVFVSSIAGIIGLPGASIYSAGKGALTGLCESLRIELDGSGVHVGIAYIGFTENDPEKRILAADGSLVPSGRPAHTSQDDTAREIARLIERRRRHVVTSVAGRVGLLAHRVSPAFVERAIRYARARDLGVYRRFS